MENTRRSFDRSRELGLKKPRLADEQPNPNLRPFPQRSAVALPPAAAAARYRVNNDRDSEIIESSRGGDAYQPQPQPYHELVSQYKTALAGLTFNSKPIITNLTIIAGENLHAAKAIASTVCNNILEVPSDQKLPSLYLLDSIVKNIGRDYIKYFASRLPEVFCEAYRQVDAPVHQSMRHLFGTWKGVFPLQSLQMIEKELGFAPAVNGSSSVASIPRPESQQRRPQQSIHVNPKYLEIQSLQQSGRSIQHSQRETASELVHEKKIPAVYGDTEYSSDIPRNSGLGMGRTGGRAVVQGHEKLWHGAGNSVLETNSGQRNYFSMKHGGPNYPTPKPSNIDLHLKSARSTVSKSNSSVSASWKNSEEEEFMWDMHSRLSDQDAADLSINSKKERWTQDGLEKLEFDNQHRKPLTGHGLVSRFSRETSSNSQPVEQKEQVSFRNRLSSPWQLRDAHQIDATTSSNPIVNAGSEIESYSAPLGELPLGGRSSLPRVTGRQHMEKLGSLSTGALGQQRIQSLGVTSAPGQSTLPQKPPSPSLRGRYPRQQLQNSSEQDLSQSLPYPQLSGKLVRPGTFESNIQPPISSEPPPKVAASRKRVAPASTDVSEDDTSVTSSVPQKKEEQPLPSGAVDKAPNPISNLLSSLVAKGLISASKSESSSSSLPTNITVESEKQNLSLASASPKLTSSLPVSSTIAPSSAPPAIPAISNSSPKDKLGFPKADTVQEQTKSGINGVIGLEFKSGVLREMHPPVINALYDDLQRCSICGLQFKLKERLDRHMAWHNWRKTGPDGTNRVTRGWYADSEEWVAGKAGFPFEIESSDYMDDDEPMVPADENQCACFLCGELFEDYFSQKRKKWMFKAAQYLALDLRDGNTGSADENSEGPIVHVSCVSETSVDDLGLASAIEKDG